MQIWFSIATAALLFTPLPAAPDWHRVSGSGAATWYVDLASIRPDGQWTSVSEISIYREVSQKTGVKSLRMQTRYDCAARTYRYVHVLALGPNGEVKLDKSFAEGEGQIRAIPTDSVVDGVVNFVCGTTRNTGVRVADPLTDTPN